MKSHQTETINEDLKSYKKEPDRTSGLEKYKNWNEKLSRSLQHEMQVSRRISELLQRLTEMVNSEAQNEKRIRWTEPQKQVGHH